MGFPGSSDWSGHASRVTLPLCSEVLASTDHSIRFSPVVGARCRPPMSKITLLHPFMGKTVRIIRNPPAHCKHGGNKNEIENMVRTKSFATRAKQDLRSVQSLKRVYCLYPTIGLTIVQIFCQECVTSIFFCRCEEQRIVELKIVLFHYFNC